MIMTKFILSPLPGFLVVAPLEQNTGSFQVSDNAANKEGVGIVMAVGDSFMFYEGTSQSLVKCPVKVGDKIVFSSGNSYLDSETGERLSIVRFHSDPVWNQVLCVINK